ncbi:MAG: hypothetical protein ACT4OZ_17455 [Gemmatimonadota bacterium]
MNRAGFPASRAQIRGLGLFIIRGVPIPLGLAQLIAIGFAAGAQQPRERPLEPATATLDYAFSSIISVRELADRRLLVSDLREGSLLVADFAGSRVAPVGRRGAGPNEYTIPAPLYPLQGDTTLMVNLLSRRALLLAGDRIVETLPSDSPIFRSALEVAGADNTGRVLLVQLREMEPPKSPGVMMLGEGDSTNLVLVDRLSTRVDTVARARIAERRFEFSESQFGGIATRILTPNPLAVKEPAALSADGWIAVVRRNPYRVDWRRPDGNMLRGQPLPHERVRVDDAEKVFIMGAWAAERDGRRRDPGSVGDWPQYYPPYSAAPAGVLLLAGDGKVAVRRSATRRAPQARYDVIDRTGRLVGRVVLSPGSHLVGFGAGSAYAVAVDADGLQRLSRHPWPF